MENKNNGKGIGVFYGVIGVATLVVAMVGATFAYFAASTNSATNAISTNSSTVSALGFTQNIDGIKSNLIPVDETLSRFKSVVGLTANSCKDDLQNNICSTYQFTVTNPNAQAQNIYVYFKPQQNTFNNLHYAVFKGTPTSYDVTADAVTDLGAAADGALVVEDTKMDLNDVSQVEWTNLRQTLAATTGSATYTIVVWLHDIGTDQTTLDAGKAFAAGVTISTGEIVDGEVTSGVTGILSTTGV